MRQLTGDGPTGPRPVPPSGGGGGGGGGGQQVSAQGSAAPQATHQPYPAPRASVSALVEYQSFDQIIALIREKRDMKLLTDVESFVGIAHYAPGRIDFQPAPGAPNDLAQALGAKLNAWTGARWMISVVSEGGEPTVSQVRKQAEDDARSEVSAHPLVAAALTTFPGAEIREIRALSAMEEDVPPPPEEDDDLLDDDWSPVDPFSD